MSRTLYCQGKKEPVGIDRKAPELSWTLDGEERAQRGFEIRLREGERQVFDSGFMEGGALHYTLPPLLERNKDYTWTLNWVLDGGEKGSSEASFSTGMFSQDDWQASFITGGTLLRKEFHVTGELRSARAFFTGLGYCEAYINGEKLTDAVLFPSYTVYEKTVEYTAVDVKELLVPGENAIGLMLGGHWPLDESLRAKEVYSAAFFRGRCMGIFQLDLVYEDGRKESVCTDRTWKTSQSPVVCSGVFDGERYDARLEQVGFCRPGFDDRGWDQAVLSKDTAGRLQYSYLPPIRVVGDMPVKALVKRGKAWIVDFGQNFTGWVRLCLNEKPGTTVCIRHAEVLYEDGTINVENLRAARAMDTYICKGDGPEIYEPRFTYHGFRYAQITGIQGRLTPDQVLGRRVHTDNQEAGDFSCSSEEINKIYRAMKWTMKSNMHSIPTDCCQRDERQGWLADAGVSAEFGVLNFGLNGFYRKWFRDIRDTQLPDGSLPLAGAPGWPRDTFIWKIGYYMALRSLYLYTGDREAVAENYPALKAYENHLHSTLVDGLLPYDFYNDWLAIEFANNLMIANAFLADFYQAMILFAEVMEDEEEVKCLRVRLEALIAAIHEKFYGKCLDNPLGTGYYGTCDTLAVAPSAMALQFGIVPENVREKVIREMMFQLCESRGSVQYPTGILTSGILTQCLSEIGFDKTVYDFLCREDYPSFRFMLSKGATTVWERWQYLVHNEMNSHNHPALCSVGTWFFKGLCGLRKITPRKDGKAEILLNPFIPEDMEYAEMKWKTSWGELALRWEKTEDGTLYHMQLPGAFEAVLETGAGSRRFCGGSHSVLLGTG